MEAELLRVRAVGYLTHSMKSKLLLFLLALAAASGLPAMAQDAPKANLKKPVLRQDDSPVGDAKAPVVTSFADTLEGVRPAVVSVYSTKVVRQRMPQFYRQFFGNLPDQERKLSGLGSGVVVSADGYIMTNNHVVEGADELEVQLSDERKFPATVIGTDPKTDIAVIKIESENLPFATLTNSDRLRVGDLVFAIGNPLGVGQTVTMGIISATGRKNVNLLTDRAPDAYEDFIQTDAAINMGNSGGALVDAKGRLIGVNSGIATNNQGNIGIGFAVPINLASSVMHSLISTGTVVRGYLGVSTMGLEPDFAEMAGLNRNTKGVVITDLSPEDGPAAKAGLKREDIIIELEGKPVASRDDLRLMIAQTPPGTKVAVKVLRETKELTIYATLGRLEEEGVVDGDLLPGVKISAITEELRREMRLDDRAEGVVITEVNPQSRYNGIFPPGGVIEQINRGVVTDVASAKQALNAGAKNRALINYRGVRRYVIFDAP